MITIYHNPRCSKSRQALEYLKEQKLDFTVREYLKDVLSKNEIKELLKQLNIRPLDLIRKGEPIFKENYKDVTLSDAEWINVLVEHPILIERPIVVKDGKAAIGRPLENIMALVAK